MSGSSGNDSLTGGAGNDKQSGGSGNDKFKPGPGKDRVSGGSGDDSVNSVDNRREGIDCGKGRGDRARVDRTDSVKNCESVMRVG
jgi:Ca2+-binding RTX toxin-like protein